MPEAPEITFLTDTLNRDLSGKKLVSIKIDTGKYRDSPPDGCESFTNALPLTVNTINSKGKFIYITFQNSNWQIWNTLGLTGEWSKTPAKNPKNISMEFVFELATYYFNDQIHYGTVKFVDDFPVNGPVNGQVNGIGIQLTKKLKTLGPDILKDDIDLEIFIKRVRKHDSKNVVEVLMDQKVVSGVGNYLVAEILYDAKISPNHKISELDNSKLETILNSTKYVSKLSYMSQGGINDYNNRIKIRIGDFSYKVYERDQDPHGNPVKIDIRVKNKQKRRTFWVPAVQT